MLISANRESCLTDTAVNFDLKDLNQELIDVVETVKCYGFLDWSRGYYMNWVILNSGIPNATIPGLGGYQEDRWGHMSFESSEECACNWGTGDDANRGSALHESIHAPQAELWAFNNEASGWTHEAHNCYAATMRAHMVENKHTEGCGAALAQQMPHVPIESMGMRPMARGPAPPTRTPRPTSTASIATASESSGSSSTLRWARDSSIVFGTVPAIRTTG